MATVTGTATGENSIGVIGTSTGPSTVGVLGQGESVGVRGEGKNWHGTIGISQSTIGGAGVYGANDLGTGVVGESKEKFNAGVLGVHKGESGFGVRGLAEKGTGTVGESKTWHGVYGKSESVGFGVCGEAEGTGVGGISKTWHGVYGETHSTTGGAGVWGEHKASGNGVVGLSLSGVGVFGKGGRLAGLFEGDVEVTGDIRLTNADFAEDFSIADVATAEPGTVMAINDDGALQPSEHAYDRRVAGVISGAGDYKPAIVLDKQHSINNRLPIALVGKVYCKVDAQYGAVEVGDLLTTSPTPGHAMKAADPLKAFGAVIGKALRPLPEGQGLIPILIALQ